jgi:beta-lactamase superfamily II metal-dependent hydrolase
MHLTAFQSDKGDSLLLESSDRKRRVLIDGGMKRSYSRHVAPALGALRKGNNKLDVLYISHIDEDHIAGALQLLDDEAEWRVHEHQKRNGNHRHSEPSSPRPPQVGTIFHNSFHDQLGKNSGEIQDVLAATATLLSGADHPRLKAIAEHRRNLVASIPQAMKVSQRIKAGQLNIPLNPEFRGKLMMVMPGAPDIELGSMRLKIIGPFPADLTKLRKEWNRWLKENQRKVESIRAQARMDENKMSLSQLERFVAPLQKASEEFGARELALAKTMGSRTKVTTPNLASLMFLAEENGTTILLTGDGHWEDILKGLEHHELAPSTGPFHVDVLKVQHHGSEHNINKIFCDRVIADHYVFCGNGQHENPDVDVLQLIFDRRMVNDQRPFKFWFNSSAKVSIDATGRTHMKKVEKLVATLAAKSKSRLRNRFIKGDSVRIM